MTSNYPKPYLLCSACQCTTKKWNYIECPNHFLLLVLPKLWYQREREVIRQKCYLSMWHLLRLEQMKIYFTLGHFFNNILIFWTFLELIKSIRVSILNDSHSIKHILRWIFERIIRMNLAVWKECRLLLIIFQSQHTSVGLWFLPGNPSGCFLLMTLKVTHLVKLQFVNSLELSWVSNGVFMDNVHKVLMIKNICEHMMYRGDYVVTTKNVGFSKL